MAHAEKQTNDTINGFPAQAYSDLLVSAFPDIDPAEPVLGATDAVEVAPNLHDLLRDDSVTVASLEENGQLVGCSIALPIGAFDPGRASEADETAYIYYTAIAPEHQGEGRVGVLTSRLLEQLAANGYSYVERDCVIAGGYADNVQKTYKEAIVATHDHTQFPEIGPERFFRIELGRTALQSPK